MDSISSIISTVKSKVSSTISKSNSGGNNKTLYTVQTENWYQSYPYGFKAQRGGNHFTFYLPINPQNINIVTHFATNVVSTLYGTVEEHSEQRYFDITISGTTGFSPQYTQEYLSDGNIGPPTPDRLRKPLAQPGRLRYDDFSISSLLGGFFTKTAAKIDGVVNQAGSITKSIAGSNGFKSGVYNNTSGYAAFHNFYQFLLRYKINASSGGSPNTKNSESMSPSVAADAPLIFLNFKDNNQYSCAIQRFTLVRSADNPMLYNYNIQMRAYDLRPITNDKAPTLRDRYADLGLDTKMSIAARIKLPISLGKTILSSGKGALKTLGKGALKGVGG